MKVQDSVAVVSGAASGLGEGTARHLLAQGARAVIGIDVDDVRGTALAGELGEAFEFHRVDISDSAAVDDVVADVAQRLGGIDVLVCAAGIAGPAKLLGRNGPIPMERFDRVVRVNLYGTVHLIRAVAPVMRENAGDAEGGRGVIITVASGAAYEGQVGQVAYSASKAALVGMTLPLARELGDHGIRVVNVAPGAFETPMYDQIPDEVKDGMTDLALFPRRFGTAREFALFVEEIVRNPMHNGRAYRLDGGLILPARS